MKILKLMCFTPSNILFIGLANLIPHEDLVDAITPTKILFIGVRILIPHGDILDVITPMQHIVHWGGEF